MVKHKNICVFTDTMMTCCICLRRADEMWSFLLSFSCSVMSVCDPMECNAPGFPILHHLLDFAQTHIHQVGDAIQPSHPLSFFSCLQSFPASGSFPISWVFISSGQSIGVSASASPFQCIFRIYFL